jgi:hypothetical protein
VTTFLVCEFLVGDQVLDCEEKDLKKLSEQVLKEGQHDCAKSGNIWITYEANSVLPRYLVRLAPQVATPAKIRDTMDAFNDAVDIPKGVVDASAVRVTESLQQAIDAAADGATLVLSGVFRETIVLSGKSLRLVGDGQKSVIHAPADDPNGDRPTATVRMAGKHVFSLEGITMRANKRRGDSLMNWKKLQEEWTGKKKKKKKVPFS